MRIAFLALTSAILILALSPLVARAGAVAACPTGRHAISGSTRANTPLLLYFDGDPVGGSTSDASGRYSIPLHIGRDIPRGAYPVEVRVRDARRQLVQSLTCVVPGANETVQSAVATSSAGATVAPTSTSQATIQPTITLMPTATVRPSPTINPVHNTNGRDLWNCEDFPTWTEADAVYRANLPDDPNQLDGDGDGIPCEDLPGAP